MKSIESYPTYEEAEENQITLLAMNIDCKIKTPSQSIYETAHGYLPEYHLLVAESDEEEAKKYVEKKISEDYEPLVKCPHCKSGNKKEYETNFFIGFLGLILILPMVVAIIWQRIKGRKYICSDCGKKYRYNFRS